MRRYYFCLHKQWCTISPFPALAGMNRLGYAEEMLSDAVPRARGDEPKWFNYQIKIDDRSPRSRG